MQAEATSAGGPTNREPGIMDPKTISRREALGMMGAASAAIGLVRKFAGRPFHDRRGGASGQVARPTPPAPSRPRKRSAPTRRLTAPVRSDIRESKPGTLLTLSSRSSTSTPPARPSPTPTWKSGSRRDRQLLGVRLANDSDLPPRNSNHERQRRSVRSRRSFPAGIRDARRTSISRSRSAARRER